MNGSHEVEAGQPSKLALLSEHRRIVGAIVLQDMQTRFGRSYFSYLVAIAWPMVHALCIMGGYLLVNRIAPVGDDPTVFALTGVLPYILCFYPGRSMPMIYLQNKQLLNMPIIRPIHIVVSGLIIELLTGMVVLTLIFGASLTAGIDVIPRDITTASLAILATLYLGIGLGTFNVLCTALLGPFYMVFYITSMIGLYLTSGVYIPGWMIPESTRIYLEYNPLFNLVEWTRSAFYASYDPDLISKSIVLWTATCTLLLGLAGERFLRNKFYT